MKKQIWTIVRTNWGDHFKYLEAGYEPFAVTEDTPDNCSTKVYMRKRTTIIREVKSND